MLFGLSKLVRFLISKTQVNRTDRSLCVITSISFTSYLSLSLSLQSQQWLSVRGHNLSVPPTTLATCSVTLLSLPSFLCLSLPLSLSLSIPLTQNRTKLMLLPNYAGTEKHKIDALQSFSLSPIVPSNSMNYFNCSRQSYLSWVVEFITRASLNGKQSNKGTTKFFTYEGAVWVLETQPRADNMGTMQSHPTSFTYVFFILF